MNAPRIALLVKSGNFAKKFLLSAVLLIAVASCGKGSGSLKTTSPAVEEPNGGSSGGLGSSGSLGTSGSSGTSGIAGSTGSLGSAGNSGSSGSLGTSGSSVTVPTPPTVLPCEAQLISFAPSIQVNSSGSALQPWSSDFIVQLHSAASFSASVIPGNPVAEYMPRPITQSPDGSFTVIGKLSTLGAHTISYAISDLSANVRFQCSLKVNVNAVEVASTPAAAKASVRMYILLSHTYGGSQNYMLSTDPYSCKQYGFSAVNTLSIYPANTVDGIYAYANIYSCYDSSARFFVSKNANCDGQHFSGLMGALRQSPDANTSATYGNATVRLMQYYNYNTGLRCTNITNAYFCGPDNRNTPTPMGYGEP